MSKSEGTPTLLLLGAGRCLVGEAAGAAGDGGGGDWGGSTRSATASSSVAASFSAASPNQLDQPVDALEIAEADELGAGCWAELGAGCCDGSSTDSMSKFAGTPVSTNFATSSRSDKR